MLGLPRGSDSKEFPCNVWDLCLIPGLGRSPGGGHGNPLQYSCLENPHGQRSLAIYSPWACKESDMNEWLSTNMICYFKWLCLCTCCILYLEHFPLAEVSLLLLLEDSEQPSPPAADTCDLPGCYLSSYMCMPVTCHCLFTYWSA